MVGVLDNVMSSNLNHCYWQNAIYVIKYKFQLYKLYFTIFEWVEGCDVINVELTIKLFIFNVKQLHFKKKITKS